MRTTFPPGFEIYGRAVLRVILTFTFSLHGLCHSFGAQLLFFGLFTRPAALIAGVWSLDQLFARLKGRPRLRAMESLQFPQSASNYPVTSGFAFG